MKQYYNFKKFYPIILRALLDDRCCFTWVSVGAPDNTHESTFFQSTDNWDRIEAGISTIEEGGQKW